MIAKAIECRPIIVVGNSAVKLLDENVFPKEILELAIRYVKLGKIKTIPKKLYNQIWTKYYNAYQEFKKHIERYKTPNNEISKFIINLLALTWYTDAFKDEIIFILEPINMPQKINLKEESSINKDKDTPKNSDEIEIRDLSPSGILVVGKKKTLPAAIGQKVEVPHKSYRGVHYGEKRTEIWIRVRNLPYHKDPAIVLIPYPDGETYRIFLIYGDTINGFSSVGRVLRNLESIEKIVFWDRIK